MGGMLSDYVVINDDCLSALGEFADNSVDAIVTDPPYGLSALRPEQVAEVIGKWAAGDREAMPTGRGFMGKGWDVFVPPPAVWDECLRVLKPGGHMAVFSGARTQDLMGLSIRLAGFEIRDTLGWIYGSGFPKSMDIGKAIDKARREDAAPVKAVAKALRSALEASGKTRKEIDAHFGTANVSQYWFSPHRNSQIPPVDKWPWLRDFLGIDSSLDAEVWRLNGRKGAPGEAWEKREVTGMHEQPSAANEWAGNYMGTKKAGIKERRDIPSSDAAKQWSGWGTSLKPAIEPIILARKPLDGTVANNVLEHGAGGLNIDACRVGISDEDRAVVDSRSGVSEKRNSMFGVGQRVEDGVWKSEPAGRFPANVLLDEHAAKEMDQQSGVLDPGGQSQKGTGRMPDASSYAIKRVSGTARYQDRGGASKFFPVFKYQPKAPKKERPVVYKNNCECEEWQSQQRATTGSTETEKQSWNTSASGSSTTAQCQTDTTYTTSTTTNSTTGSKTSNVSANSTISESTQDAKSETANGGNHAESAESLSQSEQNTGTSVKRAGHSTDGAGHVTSAKWYTTSECEKCGEPRRKVQHVTVKPLKLMEWLVTLITPEGGTVLDPFAGSGTTLQAARDNGFTAIGIEQDPEYIQLIKQRMGDSDENTPNLFTE